MSQRLFPRKPETNNCFWQHRFWQCQNKCCLIVIANQYWWLQQKRHLWSKPTWPTTMVVLDRRVLPAQQWQAICLPYLGGVFLTQQSTNLLNKGKERIRFQIKKQGNNTIPKNMMKNAFKNLLFSIASITTMLQSTVWLAFVACNQSTKESEKRSVFKWVAVPFRTKIDSKKTFKLDNQMYHGPKISGASCHSTRKLPW